jgi:hypothetical protein
MKKSLIWIAVGAAVIGVGVPAYASVQTSKPQPSITTVKTTVEDISGNCDEAEHANDPSCTGAAAPVNSVDDNSGRGRGGDDNGNDTTENSIDDNDDATENSIDDNDDATENSIDDNDVTENSIDDNDVTENSIEDISGPCDEAEHANDPRCTGAAAPVNSVDDSSGRDGNDDSGRGGSGGSDDSGHGGSDD